MKIRILEGEELLEDDLKDKRNKIANLLKKIDEKLAIGEIDKDHHKKLYEKYNREIENLDSHIKNLKNQIIEKELLQEVGIEKTEINKNIENKELVQEVGQTKNGYDKNNKGSISSAFFWMLFLSIILFWAPVIGPLLAGFVGGRKAGSIEKAILAALLPAIIIFFIFTTILAPLLSGPLGPLGTLLGTAIGGIIGIIIIIDSTVLIIGAIIGALAT